LDQLIHNPQSGKRWILELLQNAKDAARSMEQVNIEIEYSDEYVEFRHSGAPFTLSDLQSLTFSNSLKNMGDEEKEEGEDVKMEEVKEEVTGKFDTGFITTLLLSRVCQLFWIKL